jgi:mono/diheme cytochrome c family protein
LKMTGMPSFGKTHDDNQVWSIVAFIEQLPGMSYQQYQQIKQQAAPASPTVSSSAMPMGRR